MPKPRILQQHHRSVFEFSFLIRYEFQKKSWGVTRVYSSNNKLNFFMKLFVREVVRKTLLVVFKLPKWLRKQFCC